MKKIIIILLFSSNSYSQDDLFTVEQIDSICKINDRAFISEGSISS